MSYVSQIYHIRVLKKIKGGRQCKTEFGIFLSNHPTMQAIVSVADRLGGGGLPRARHNNFALFYSVTDTCHQGEKERERDRERERERERDEE